MELYDVLLKRIDANQPYLGIGNTTYSQTEIEKYIHCIEEKFLILNKDVITLKIEDQFLLICAIWACIKSKKSFVLLPDKIEKKQENKLMQQALSNSKLTLITKIDLNKEPSINDLIIEQKEVNLPTKITERKTSIAFISSGTTGAPKLIWVSYLQCIHSLQAIHESSFMPYTKNAHVLLSPLITHSYGFSCLLEYTMNNASIVIPRQASMLGVFNLITKKEVQLSITTIEGVPYFYKQLQVLKNKIKFKNLSHIGFGGDFVTHILVTFFKKYYSNLTFSIRYGISEIPSIISLEKFKDPSIQDGLGDILSIYDVKIRRTGKGKKEGEIMVHYKDDISNTITTEDLGLLKNRKLKILGRKSSFIKVKGYRISCIQIEEAIKNSKTVDDVKVSTENDRIAAYIVPKEIPFKKNDLKKYLNTQLPYYSIPDTINEVVEIKRTITGKIIRR